MPTRPVGVGDADVTGTAFVDVDTIEHPSSDITTTTTADPGAAGTSLAVTSAAKFPTVNGYKIRVEAEVMRVTAGAGTATWTVTRGVDGTSAVAHAVGVSVAQVVAVQRVEPIDGSRIVTYVGRISTFRTPGRAGTAGQKIAAIHNATGSPVKVQVTSCAVDLLQTVVKAVTTTPPIIRLWKFTAVPASGSTPTKVPQDSSLVSNASVTVWEDASADGTSSATALTITLPAGTIYTEEFAPRLITAAGYEMFDRTVFLEGEDQFVTLNALEGVALFLDYAASLANPVTDMWIAVIEWEEYTLS